MHKDRWSTFWDLITDFPGKYGSLGAFDSMTQVTWVSLIDIRYVNTSAVQPPCLTPLSADNRGNCLRLCTDICLQLEAYFTKYISKTLYDQ